MDLNQIGGWQGGGRRHDQDDRKQKWKVQDRNGTVSCVS